MPSIAQQFGVCRALELKGMDIDQEKVRHEDMRKRFGNEDNGPSVAISWVLPTAVPLLLWLAEYYVLPVTFLIPLGLVVFLCYLALRLKPSAIIFWTIAYMAFVILAAQIFVQPPPTNEALRPFVRSVFVFAGGTTAVFLAINRLRMRKSNAALLKVISVLPSPVIVSDISGNIFLMNDASRRLLASRISRFSGLSFFSAFVAPAQQGREIEKYISYFERDDEGSYAATLQTRGEEPLILDVMITIVTLDKTRYAVTAIEDVRQDVRHKEFEEIAFAA
jgi:glucan phosphoethanolaminetransferase (alkaline phosphatase superfamily)